MPRDHTIDYPDTNPRPARTIRVAVGGRVAGRPPRTTRGVVMNECRVRDCPTPGLCPAGVCTLRAFYDEAALRG